MRYQDEQSTNIIIIFSVPRILKSCQLETSYPQCTYALNDSSHIHRHTMASLMMLWCLYTAVRLSSRAGDRFTGSSILEETGTALTEKSLSYEFDSKD